MYASSDGMHWRGPLVPSACLTWSPTWQRVRLPLLQWSLSRCTGTALRSAKDDHNLSVHVVALFTSYDLTFHATTVAPLLIQPFYKNDLRVSITLSLQLCYMREEGNLQVPQVGVGQSFIELDNRLCTKVIWKLELPSIAYYMICYACILFKLISVH